MPRKFITRIWIAAALLLPALAMGQATPGGALAVNAPGTTATPDVGPFDAPIIPLIAPPEAAPVAPSVAGPVAPPIVPVVAAAPPVSEPAVTPVAASQPVVAAAAPSTPATKPAEIYRSAIEKMSIRESAPEADAGSSSTQSTPSQALKTGLSQTGIGTAIQVGGALLIVVGLIFVAKAMAKKWVPGAGASNGKNVIEILARYPLAKAQSLVMVRIGSQIVVLNQTREASTSVLVISEQTEVASILGQIQGGKPNSIQAGFTKLLANAQMDLEREDMNQPDAIEARMAANSVMEEEQLDEQLDEMAAAKRQLMELRTQVRTIRENLK